MLNILILTFHLSPLSFVSYQLTDPFLLKIMKTKRIPFYSEYLMFFLLQKTNSSLQFFLELKINITFYFYH